MRYADRTDAGRRLAEALTASDVDLAPPVLVLGVARGGVPVAAEVAKALDAELDVAVARKVGAPGNPEYAIGAIAEGGEPILNESVILAAGIPGAYVAATVRGAVTELSRRAEAYRGSRPPHDERDKVVVVVDDGVATGSTLVAVLRAVRGGGPRRLVCAVPVGPPDTIARLGTEADDVVCPMQPPTFTAVGGWYGDFSQLSDEDVIGVLDAQRPG